MSNWFFAANGQQQGPYPEAQFRDLIAGGTVRADTLVWSEGMAGWQKAAEVPGLMARAGGPPSPGHGARQMMGAGMASGNALSRTMDAGMAGTASGNALSLDMGILDFTWRTLVFVIGTMFIIPFPWLLIWYMRWLTSCVQVPGRPNLSFEGTVMPVAIWFFGFIAAAIVIGFVAAFTGFDWLGKLINIATFVLYWLFLRWFVENIASNGQLLGLSFSGSIWAFLGWSILTVISFITIIGWAWVYAAMARWLCQNIQGTRRQVVFKGTGLEILWRGIVTGIASFFIIPIPWVYRWFMSWQLSQTELVARGTGE